MPVVGVDLNEDWVARQRFTKAERKVLDLLIRRFTIKEIATMLAKSPKTVYVQAQSMVNKVGATSIAELVCLATTQSARLDPGVGAERLRRVV